MGGQPAASVARDFQVSTKTVHKWVVRFRAHGPVGLDDRSSRPHHIARRHLQPGNELSDAIFALLHTPPRDNGFNRTTWRLADLHSTLKAQGVLTTLNNLSAVIKQAGYQWKKARVTLTSSDPLYREKVDAIKKALSELKDDEAFFSIDEFGPFAIKMRGGRALQPPGSIRHVPQWQKSKGSLIVSAALELSRNQIIHFYSDRKNSAETCKLIDQLRRQYKGYRRIYLSWDAAPWHSSEQLFNRVEFLNDWAEHDEAPHIEILPLPAQAQFLNVIESVFSGMARAIIHNSNYATVAEAQTAITRYLEDRNRTFAIAPRRAGRSIWRQERVPATFTVTNNCKDVRYR
jgi:transposase